jgi:signal transduction histidine kinase/ActR/RegA family two-component response regulator
VAYAEAAGLEYQRVFDLAFEPDGTIWLAAGDGLRRYDGYTWQRYGVEAGLPSSFVRAVCLTRGGDLWVGSDAGAGVFDYRQRKYDPRGSGGGLAGPHVRRIVEDPDGSLWFACDQWPDTSAGRGGLAGLANGRWESHHREQGLPVDYVLHYFRDSLGRRYAMTPRGWVQWQGDHWEAPRTRGQAQEPTVLGMTEGPGGVLFAQGESQLLVLRGNEWQPAGRETAALCATREGEVVAACRDSQRGLLWFGVWDGEHFVRQSATVSYAPGSQIYTVRQAPDGDIWCVGVGLVVRWNYRAGPWTFHPDLPPPQKCDPWGHVWFSGDSNVVVSQDGRYLRFGGLQKLVGVANDGRIFGFGGDPHTLVEIPGTDPSQVRPLDWQAGLVKEARMDAAGVLWAWTDGEDGKLAIGRYEDNRWQTLADPRLEGKRIQSTTPDPRQGLWIVTQSARAVEYGLAHLSGTRVEWHDFGANRPPLTYPGFALAADRMWLHGYSGLFERSRAADGVWQAVGSLANAGVMQALSLGEEVAFTFTDTGGGGPGCALWHAGQWQRVKGGFSRLGASADLRTLFLSARGGIFVRREPGSLELDFLPLPTGDYAGTVVEDRSRGLWIGTAEGVFHYTPTATPPETTLRLLAAEVRQQTQLRVEMGGVVRFGTACPPDAFRYSWRFDRSAWSPFVEWTTVSAPTGLLPLGDLPPGRHRLEVRARDAFGNVDATAATREFAILPIPLQERPWFVPLVVAVMALIGFLGWIGVSRTREIARSNSALRAEVTRRGEAEAELQAAHGQLEQRVAERTAELSEANASLSREIAERQRAEASRQRLEEQLRHAQKMEAIGTLAGGVAHDFNNILAAIVPYTHLAIEDAGENRAVKESLEQVLQAAGRATRLVQQILAFSRRQKQERRLVDLAGVLRETLQLLRSTLPASIETTTRFQASLPPVLADPTQLHQVIMNLATNAAHAMRDRPGRLEVTLEAVRLDGAMPALRPGLPPGRYVRLAVQDNGCGMPPEVVARVFDPFFTTKGPGEGTGLGLAVVHGIVKDHDGAIFVNSREDTGTLFEVFLPARQGEAEAAKESTPAKSARGTGERILLVDDEPAVCSALSRLLKREGYEVTEETDPTKALDLFLQAPDQFQLLLTDLSMPGMTGVELAKQVLQRKPGLPIILATGYGGDWAPATAEAAGIRRVVQKPISPLEIGAMVREVLSNQPPNRTQAAPTPTLSP